MKLTVKEKLASMLVEHGMFESQAKEVMEQAIVEINEMSKHLNGDTLNEKLEVVPNEPYVITWDAPSDHYHKSMYGVWFITVKKHAIIWIDANKPDAWFRNIFL